MLVVWRSRPPETGVSNSSVNVGPRDRYSWIVERNFACLGKRRRFSKDYEHLTVFRLLINRLV